MAMTDETTDLAGALSPLLEARGLDLVDVEMHGAQLTVFVDREGGVGLDELGAATKDVSAALDEIDPIPGRYILSVSSPGSSGGCAPRPTSPAPSARRSRCGSTPARPMCAA